MENPSKLEGHGETAASQAVRTNRSIDRPHPFGGISLCLACSPAHSSPWMGFKSASLKAATASTTTVSTGRPLKLWIEGRGGENKVDQFIRDRTESVHHKRVTYLEASV